MEAPNGEGVPANYRDASVDTSDVEGGMVATNGNRQRMQGEVVEVLGIILPPGAGPHDDLFAVLTSSMDAYGPTGMRFQRIQRREDLDASTHATRDTTHDLTLGTEGIIPRVQRPGLVQWLQLVTIARLCRKGTSWADSWSRPELPSPWLYPRTGAALKDWKLVQTSSTVKASS